MAVPRRDRWLGKVPLHWVLAVPFVVLTTSAVGLVGWLSYRSGQKSVENMAYHLLQQTSQRVSDRLTVYLQTPQQVIAAHRLAATQGLVNLQNPQQVNARLWQAFTLTPWLSGNVYQAAQGWQMGYGRLQSRELTQLASRLSGEALPHNLMLAQRIDQSGTWQQTFSLVDGQGNPTRTVFRVTNDVRRTPWYQQAQASPQQAWSPIFVYQVAPTLGIVATAPVYNAQRQLQGIFLSGLALSEISSFLQSLNFSPTGQSFIVERSGLLVATSTGTPVFRKIAAGSPQRLLARQSQNLVTQQIAQHLQRQPGDLQRLTTPTRLRVELDQHQQFVQVTPFRDDYGLDWLIVTVVPESDFNQEMQRNSWFTLLLTALTLLGTAGMGILLAFWIARPIRRLSQSSQALAAGLWQQSWEEDSRIAELSILARSFNATAGQLQHAFDRIKTALAESEEKFTTVFRTSPDPILIAQFVPGVLLEVNRQATEFCGYAPAEMIGRTLTDLELWADLAERDRWLALLHRDRRVYNFEATLQTQAQVLKTVLLSAEVQDLHGEPCIILMLRDISDRKQTEFALRESEATNRALLQAVPDLFIHVDRQGNYLQVLNPGHIPLLNPAILKAEGNIRDTMPPAFAHQRLAYIERALATQTTQIYEYQVEVAGRLHYEEARIAPCMEDSALVIVRDISDRKRAEIALRQALQELTYHVEHSPLATIRWNREFRVEGWSKQAELIFGWQAAEVVGKNMSDWPFIFEADAAVVSQTAAQLLRGEPTRCLNRNYHKDGSVVYCEWYNSALLNEQGELISILSLTQDVTQRTLAEIALQRNEEQMRLLADALPVFISYADTEQRYRFVNRTYEQFFGRSRAQMQGQHTRDVIGAENYALSRPYIERALAGETVTYEVQLPNQAGDRVLSVVLVPDWTDQQQVRGYYSLVIDISDRKAFERSLQRYERIVSATADAMALIDRDYRYQLVNQTYLTWHQKAYTDIVGHSVEALLGTETFTRVVQPHLDRCLAGETVQYSEWFDLPSLGRQFANVTYAPYTEADQTISGIVVSVRNITPIKAAEQQLQAEADLRCAIEGAIVEGIAVADLDGCQIYVNPAFCSMLGWTEAELLGDYPPYVYWPPEEIENITQAFAACLAGDRPAAGLELRFMRQNGERFDVLILDAPLRDANDEITAWLASVYDITERKQAQRKLQQAIQEVNTHFQESPLAIMQWDREYRILRWSKQAEQLFGWTAAEVQTRDWQALLFVHPADRDLVNARLAPLLNGTVSNQTLRNRNYTQDGRVLLCQWYSSAVFDAAGDLVSVLSFVEDVTDRDRMETALRRSEQKFRGAFDTISAGMALVSLEGCFLEVNAALCEMLGYTEPELLQMQLAQLADRRDHSTPPLTAQLWAQHQTVAQLEKWLLTKPGQPLWGLINLAVMADAQGQPLYVIVQITDISDRKRAEEALSSSEARLRAILTAIPDIILLYTTDGLFLDAMQTGNLLSMVQDPNPVGKHLSQLVPQVVAERQQQAVQRILATGEPQVYEQEVVIRERLQYEEVRIVACGDNSVLVIIRDIGDRKLREIERQLAEEALRESEERFRRAFDDAAIGMAWVGLDGQFLKVSQSLTEIVGYRDSELLERRFQDITHPDDLPLDLEFSRRMLAGEQRAYQREKRYLHQQGHTIWVLVHVSLVKDRVGNPLYFVSQIQDISDRHELERIKDEFISIVSHELRTPLTAIRGSLGILETGVLDTEPATAKQMLQVALNNSDRLVRLVNDILDLERLESGKITLVPEPCWVADLLQQALESVQALALPDQITIQVRAIEAEIAVAPDAIVQAIINLLGNAIKFSQPGSTIWLQTELLPHPPAPTVQFSIRDQGRGIPPEKLETIFGRFQQIDVSDSRQKGGTGLGLAICKSIVQQHGGTIWAESVLGAGSTFYFTIPVRQPHE